MYECVKSYMGLYTRIVLLVKYELSQNWWFYQYYFFQFCRHGNRLQNKIHQILDFHILAKR